MNKQNILDRLNGYKENLNKELINIEHAKALPLGDLKTDVMYQLETNIEQIQDRIDHWQTELDLAEGTNIENIRTRLTRKSEQAQIQHALTNLVETFGIDAVIKANQTMKLTRKTPVKRKKVA